MLELNPHENLKEIQFIFERLGKYGFTFFQWSDESQPENRKGFYEEIIKKFPNYETASLDEAVDMTTQMKEILPLYVFIEAFGPAFLRADADSFLECAQTLLRRYETQLQCVEHEWAYTHKNGHKTCKKCRTFQPCSVEEALFHYSKGSVRFDDERELLFDHENPLCACGSHQAFFLKHAFLPGRTKRCFDCGEFLSDDSTSASILGTTFLERARHLMAFQRGRLISTKSIQTTIFRLANAMYKHAYYVEQIRSLAEFQTWFEPYLDEFVERWNVFFQGENDHPLQLIKVQIVTFTVPTPGKIDTMQVSLQSVLTERDLLTEEETFHQTMQLVFQSFE